MKFNSVVLKVATSETCTGFVEDYPAVCAQGDSVDHVREKLTNYLKLYFDYMSKMSLEVEPSVVENL
jgi:predicted RNase H-like HicB family nuclease